MIDFFPELPCYNIQQSSKINLETVMPDPFASHLAVLNLLHNKYMLIFIYVTS